MDVKSIADEIHQHQLLFPRELACIIANYSRNFLMWDQDTQACLINSEYEKSYQCVSIKGKNFETATSNVYYETAIGTRVFADKKASFIARCAISCKSIHPRPWQRASTFFLASECDQPTMWMVGVPINKYSTTIEFEVGRKLLSSSSDSDNNLRWKVWIHAWPRESNSVQPVQHVSFETDYADAVRFWAKGFGLDWEIVEPEN